MQDAAEVEYIVLFIVNIHIFQWNNEMLIIKEW